MAGDTIRADAPKIASAVSVFRTAGDAVGGVSFDGVATGLDAALPGGSAVAGALDRACGAAAEAATRCAGRAQGLADFAAEAHRFLEAEDSDFAELLGRVATR